MACAKKGGGGGGGSTASTPNSNPPPQSNQAPPAVAPPVQNYGGTQFDPYSGLQGYGNWVMIGDQRFFIPDRSRLSDGRDDWQPYQNGRWTYDNQRGWTWVSSDPWGWMTAHYGVWRHHRSHGWVWLPFHDMHYEPHCVTWFDEGDHIGWYPYHAEYSRAYVFTDRHGFNDGYWHGPRALFSFGVSGFGFHFGFTLVNRSDATHHHIRSRMIRDHRYIFQIAYRAHQGDRFQRVGRHPGGDRHRSFDFVQRFAPKALAPRGDAHWVTSRGGARILQPFNGPLRQDRPNDNHARNDRRDNRRDDRRGNPPAVQPPQQRGRPGPGFQPPQTNPQTKPRRANRGNRDDGRWPPPPRD
jgi:hypothetical protein